MRKLLHLLADGQIHSGEALANSLGVSRTAVWKQLKRLDGYNISLETVRGQGYRIPGGVDLLDIERLNAALADEPAIKVALELFETLPSTNTYLMEQGEPIQGYRACLAEQQSAGRGRRGRPWQSPFARNLYLSLAFDRETGFRGLDGLSLVAGVAVVRGLQSLGIENLGLKWPNDIWLGGRKLGGILVELQGEFQSACRVVIGLGLNVHMQSRDAEIDQAWTSLAIAGAVPGGGRTALASVLLRQLVTTVEDFLAQGFGVWSEVWQQYDALQGRQVKTLPDGRQGLARGVDSSGAYLIETQEGVARVNAGEISLRAVT